MKTIILLTAIAALSVFSTRPLQAHAFLDHSSPKVGSQIHGSPSEIRIWFTEELEGEFTTLQVVDASGTEVDKRDGKVDAKEKSVFSVSLPTLKPGKYKVIWKAVAVDTHVTHGNFVFEVLQ